jgi:hypothetical protein
VLADAVLADAVLADADADPAASPLFAAIDATA